MGTADSDREILTALSSMWEEFRDEEMRRVDAIERAITSLARGCLTDEERMQATREAHRLAGGVGTFGFLQASSRAHEIEQILQGNTALGETQVCHLADLVVSLRAALEGTPAEVSAPHIGIPAPLMAELPPGPQSPLLLLVDDDPTLGEGIVREAATRQYRVMVAQSPAEARSILCYERPDVVLLDLMFPDSVDDGWSLLKELTEQSHPIPVLVLTSRDTFIDRVRVATLGGRGFLSKTGPISEVFEAVVRLLQQRRLGERRVMAVDDDPLILATLQSLLSPWGISVVPVNDSLIFWESLEHSAPDLVILDIDMPNVSGIELCQVMRNDMRWSTIPVVFLTALTHPGIVRQVFAAGADDFVTKPIVGPELIARIVNRLERSRLARNLAETDPLTGLANRRKGTETLNRFLRLADRHGQPVSVAVIDIDHFRELNNRHGHDTGDVVLQGVADLLEQALRGEDMVARWGGEEFLVGMFGMTRSDGVRRLADILQTLSTEPRTSENGGARRLTFSAGVAQFPEDGADLRTLFRVADEALYQAKAAGRARVVPAGWRVPETGSGASQ